MQCPLATSPLQMIAGVRLAGRQGAAALPHLAEG